MDVEEIKYAVCPNIDHITKQDIPLLLKELRDNKLILCYDTPKSTAIQMLDWWDANQKMQWAWPSEYSPPEGWQDHLRYKKDAKTVFTQNWPISGERSGENGIGSQLKTDTISGERSGENGIGSQLSTDIISGERSGETPETSPLTTPSFQRERERETRRGRGKRKSPESSGEDSGENPSPSPTTDKLIISRFLTERWLLDPCEVCGQQGEWCTDGDPQHFLCFSHRDEWLHRHWRNSELEYIDREKQPEKWHQVWEEGFVKFVARMKEKDGVILSYPKVEASAK